MGTEYGRTPIRDLLHMSSGVDFGETRDGGRDLNRLWNGMGITFPEWKMGTVKSIVQFNQRIAPSGTRVYYASIEADVLGMVLQSAVNKSASDYLREKVWGPIGAEADANWLIDAEGFELGHFGFNAVLRDYARLGRLLAHDGAWDGKQIVPAQWMIDATTVRASDGYLLPGAATKRFGYGYLLWLFPGERRQFAAEDQSAAFISEGLFESLQCLLKVMRRDEAKRIIEVSDTMHCEIVVFGKSDDAYAIRCIPTSGTTLKASLRRRARSCLAGRCRPAVRKPLLRSRNA